MHIVELESNVLMEMIVSACWLRVGIEISIFFLEGEKMRNGLNLELALSFIEWFL